MGLLKMLQRKLESAVKTTANFDSAITPEKQREYELDDAYYEFEDHYERSCEKKESKIDAIETDNIDPDKNVAAFQKKLKLCHELEDFCASHGPGGVKYFKENYEYLYQNIQKDLDDYMKDEYADAKENYEEYKADQKIIKTISGKIVKALQAADDGSAMQKDLRKLFSDYEPYYFDSAIKSLMESGKIEKFKVGRYVAYKTK